MWRKRKWVFQCIEFVPIQAISWYSIRVQNVDRKGIRCWWAKTFLPTVRERIRTRYLLTPETRMNVE